jgi:hypothetical protein
VIIAPFVPPLEGPSPVLIVPALVDEVLLLDPLPPDVMLAPPDPTVWPPVPPDPVPELWPVELAVSAPPFSLFALESSPHAFTTKTSEATHIASNQRTDAGQIRLSIIVQLP